jgi:hypothetical protein
MRGRIVKALRELDAVSVENKVYPGTPDVNFAEGWVELKWLRYWPRNAEDSVVQIRHFTPQQRVWLKRRWNRGGQAFLLLQAAQTDWLLFDGLTAAQAVGRANRPELFERALKTWKTLNEKELKECLTRDWRT